MFIEYVAKLSDALGATLASGLCCYALWSLRNSFSHDVKGGAGIGNFSFISSKVLHGRSQSF